ncbi:putative ankyrin 2; brain [Paratrimastix pyriformis]|uniref:Ankyrin 2 n=1 Tax=Paratrimastix pyriformis TaxID=342808 RepID=A0ABQ8UE36_9EUKA|nr:putative ankyrin 2; brain [Paratrimastix pyriformis]
MGEKEESARFRQAFYRMVKTGTQAAMNNLLDHLAVSFKKQLINTPEFPTVSVPILVALEENNFGVALSLFHHGATLDCRTNDKHQWTPLHVACDHARLDTVTWLLDQGCDLHATDSQGRTPLYMAVKRGSLDIAQLLVRVGGESLLCTRNQRGRTLAHVAAHRGHATLLAWLAERRLVRVQISVCAIASGSALTTSLLSTLDIERQTPLHSAASAGHLNCCQLLLDRLGANPQAQDAFGNTPLHDAARNGHTECARFLVGRGANPHAVTGDLSTPLYMAALNGCLDIMRFLVLECQGRVDQANLEGNGPLHAAAGINDIDCVRFLVDHGAPIEQTNRTGCTPLHYAVENASDESLRFLLDQAAIDSHLDSGGESGDGDDDGPPGGDEADPAEVSMTSARTAGSPTALGALLMAPEGAAPDEDVTGFGAIRAMLQKGAHLRDADAPANIRRFSPDHIVCIKALLDLGARADCTDSRGNTPVHSAARKGDIEVLLLLLERQADALSQTNDNGDTPLHCAAINGELGCIKLLLGRGAPILPNSNGDSPLHLVAQSAEEECARYLLDHGAEIDAQNADGNTPLHLACHEDPSAENPQARLNLVRMLLERGACISIRNQAGRTPFEFSHPSCHELFRQAYQLRRQYLDSLHQQARELQRLRAQFQEQSIQLEKMRASREQDMAGFRQAARLRTEQAVQISQMSAELERARCLAAAPWGIRSAPIHPHNPIISLAYPLASARVRCRPVFMLILTLCLQDASRELHAILAQATDFQPGNLRFIDSLSQYCIKGRFSSQHLPRFLGKGCTGLVFGVYPREASSDPRIGYPPLELALKMMLNEEGTNQTVTQRRMYLMEYKIAHDYPHWSIANCYSKFIHATSPELLARVPPDKYPDKRNTTLAPTLSSMIVLSTDFAIAPTTTYLSMELCHSDLGHHMHWLQRNLAERQKLLLVAQILAAIRHLNSHSVFHLDIKGDNIMLIERPWMAGHCFVLSDFGEVQVTDRIAGKAQGNLANRCPELVRASSAHTLVDISKGDVWSCGCLAFELLDPAGQHPFAHPSRGPPDELEMRITERTMPVPMLPLALHHQHPRTEEDAMLHRCCPLCRDQAPSPPLPSPPLSPMMADPASGVLTEPKALATTPAEPPLRSAASHGAVSSLSPTASPTTPSAAPPPPPPASSAASSMFTSSTSSAASAAARSVSPFARWFVGWLLDRDPTTRPTAEQALSVLSTYLWATGCEGITQLPHYHDPGRTPQRHDAQRGGGGVQPSSLSDGELPGLSSRASDGLAGFPEASSWLACDPRRFTARPRRGLARALGSWSDGGSLSLFPSALPATMFPSDHWPTDRQVMDALHPLAASAQACRELLQERVRLFLERHGRLKNLQADGSSQQQRQMRLFGPSPTPVPSSAVSTSITATSGGPAPSQSRPPAPGEGPKTAAAVIAEWRAQWEASRQQGAVPPAGAPCPACVEDVLYMDFLDRLTADQLMQNARLILATCCCHCMR